MAKKEKLDLFAIHYTNGLQKAVTEYPNEYVYPVSKVPDVAQRMIEAISDGGIRAVTITNSRGFANAAKSLNIKNTYKGWEEFLNS